MHNSSFDIFHLYEETSEQLHDEYSPFVTLDFRNIVEVDPEYAEKLLFEPTYEVKYLSKMAENFAGHKKYVQIVNLPNTTEIHKLQRENVYSLVQVRGTVMQRGERSLRPVELVYKCPICNTQQTVEQTEQWRLSPEECSCGNKKGFKRSYDETSFYDTQWIEIQELIGNRKLSDTPSKIRVMLRNDQVDTCIPGESVTVIGIPKVWEIKPNQSDLHMRVYLDCYGLINDTEEENIDLTTEDVLELKELASQPEHLNNVINSYAPTVYGEEVVKEALAYQQCEGVTRHLTKKKRRRGQFHILLAGPPGVAKSDLGEYQSLYHHKGRQATGRGASSVGLTASVVQENGEWVLKAGAMSLADNGLLFIDEIEKMRSEDSGAMHPGMEAQQIPISKAGINATIKTRCSIVAACNPIGGRWIDDRGLVGNLIEKGKGLTIPLLNRFALTFIVKEKEEETDESLVVDHILSFNKESKPETPPYNEETLRKLFIYARTIKPVLSDEAAEKIKEFYLTLFKASKAQEGMILSRRQIEDLVRIAEASAKLHLRETVTLGDAVNSIRVMATSLKQYGIDPLTGKYDQTAVFYGQPKTRKERLKLLPNYVLHLMKKNLDTTKVSRTDLVKYLTSVWDASSSEIGEIITASLSDGAIYEPVPGYISVVD